MRWTRLGVALVGLVAFAIGIVWAWDVRRSRRRATYEASVPELSVQPVEVDASEDGNHVVGFRLALASDNFAFRTQLILRTMRARKTPISEPLARSIEIPVLKPGEEQTVYVDMSRLRPSGQPAQFRTEWIHVSVIARGAHDVVSQRSWEWHDSDPIDWDFLRFTAREPGGRVLHDEKASGYDWDPPT
jgi:hypothetical protein